MQRTNLMTSGGRLIASAAVISAIMALTMLVTGITASAEDGNPQEAPVTGLSASTGSGPGEIDVAWDTHPQGAVDYRVAWVPSGEGFRRAGNTDWNAFPAGASLTITGLEEGAEHKVKVRARFQSNPKSRWSEVVTATAAQAPQSDPPPPEPEPTPDRGRSHETPPELSIPDSSGPEPGDVTEIVEFFARLSEPASHDVTFTYSTSIEPGDTAEADDFTAKTNWTVTIPAGSDFGYIFVRIQQDFVFEGDETFTVTISDATNATITDGTATATIIDDETEPTLSIEDASATEGDDMLFNVTLSGQSDEDVTFDYATSIGADDNSESGDFTGRSGTGTIPAYSLNATVSVDTFDDGHNASGSRYEGDETFTVTISNPVGAGISRATAKGTIIDDERIPVASFLSPGRTVSESVGILNDFVIFQITPLAESPSQISFVVTGSATAGEDYTALPQTVTASGNQSELAVPLPIWDDNIFEADETIIIRLVSASANIQPHPTADTTTLTIRDDDQPTLSFDLITITVDEHAGPAVLTVNMDPASTVPITVDYETRQGIAQEGEDYTATSGTLTFAPLQTSKTISVPIIDDNVYENLLQRFDVYLLNSFPASLPSFPYAGVNIRSDDPEPTASMQDVIASEKIGTMTLTLRLSHPSDEDISYLTIASSLSGTATSGEDYENFLTGGAAEITVPAGSLSETFDITIIDDGVEEDDETIIIGWDLSGSSATPQSFLFTGTITDLPPCGDVANEIVVKDTTGEITQAGESQFLNIRLDPFKSYLIEAIGADGRDMLGRDTHQGNLTLQDPDIIAIWNARGTSRLNIYSSAGQDQGHGENDIAAVKKRQYGAYKVEIAGGDGGAGTFQLKLRVNNLCRFDDDGEVQYHWFGGPKGYNKFDIPANTNAEPVLFMGTHDEHPVRPRTERAELNGFLGDNWDSAPDEDWFAADLEQNERYSVRLRTKTGQPERHQATRLKILGIHDSDGNAVSNSPSSGVGKKVFVTNWQAPSTGRYYIAVGSKGTDRTGTYWISITKKIGD